MTQNVFKVIKGGIDLPPDIDSRKFVSAYATDTRLMGVVCICILWKVEKYGIPEDFHQFFYLDAEEYAIENYISVSGNKIDEIHDIEISLIGGLGGKKIELTERECSCILSIFADMNTRLNLPLPYGEGEYSFLISDISEFTKYEIDSATAKICTPIENYFQLIHYFLMRIFGKDYHAADLIARGLAGGFTENGLPLDKAEIDLNIYSELEPATLCKNTIDIDFKSPENTFICESLIEASDNYMLAVSKITINDDRVITDFEKISLFRVSAAEAAMQLSRGEFVTLYNLLIEPEEFELYADDLLDTAMPSTHDNGKLYMLFHKDNDHVKRRIFLLNDDVSGVLYVSDFGQLIAVSYDLYGIKKLEHNISKSPLKRCVIPTAKYEFKESVLYDFIQSDFDDFEEFIDFIKDDNQ